MHFWSIHLQALGVILLMMTLLWLASIRLRNVSIVDLFWGAGFVLATALYFVQGEGDPTRKALVSTLVAVWGLRLSIHLALRNIGKGEDFRYQELRRNAGPERYWWYSFFQVFLLQGVLLWVISSTLLGALHSGADRPLGWLDVAASLLWLLGMTFEAGSDLQLALFKRRPENRGKLITGGFWRYTRHPNYFGDAAVWWSYGLFCLAAGAWIPIVGAAVMTFLIVKISGVALLEKSLEKKPGYQEYRRRTPAFIPWFPRAGADSR